mgnify:FL=1
MDNNIFGQFYWQMNYFVIKIKIAFFGTAAPPAFVIFNANAIKGKIVDLIYSRQMRVHQKTRALF